MNILFYRSTPGISQPPTLLEHQAISATVRSILGEYSAEEQGMVRSAHRIIAPAHLDILPLLALAAEDYVGSIGDVDTMETFAPPFILYGGRPPAEDGPDELIREFLQPQWFDTANFRSPLRTVIDRYRPEIGILFSFDQESLAQLAETAHRFSRIFAFQSLIPFDPYQLDGRSARSMMEQVTIVDTAFSAPAADFERRPPSQWEQFIGDERSESPLEPFVPFGPALEFSMF